MPAREHLEVSHHSAVAEVSADFHEAMDRLEAAEDETEEAHRDLNYLMGKAKASEAQVARLQGEVARLTQEAKQTRLREVKEQSLRELSAVAHKEKEREWERERRRLLEDIQALRGQVASSAEHRSSANAHGDAGRGDDATRQEGDVRE